MEAKVVTADCFRREIKMENGQEVVLSLDFYSVPTEQKNRIEEAARTFFDSVMEILKSNPI